ncbi:MAG: ribonuclease Y [Planctomycetota bacterium]|nr:ribonuclease Y [Planctomycetota bacterium]
MDKMDVIMLLLGLAVGAGGVFLAVFLQKRKQSQAARDIIESAKREADGIASAAQAKVREEALKQREAFERENTEAKNELRGFERRLVKREDVIDRKAESIQRREKYLDGLEKDIVEKGQKLDQKAKDLDQLVASANETLHKVSGLTKEEATATLMDKLEKELTSEYHQRIKKAQDAAREGCEEETRKVIVTALQKCAIEHTAENVVSTIDLPSEDMKGRIIGREGRNIRAFEKSTGIDVIVDDTPGVIVLSGFDSVRREMARRAMEKLIADGRIHPGRIEELVEQSKKEMEEVIAQTGKKTAIEMDIHGLHPKALALLGRLSFRTSYGQNMLQHTIEVAHLCGLIAQELKLDPVLAKRAGLLHDIGKAIDQEMEGTHPAIGADLLRRWDERKEVIEAAEKHHSDMNVDSPYTLITATADAISASRPGARRETLEKYIKRMERLEAICMSFPGVESAFAIHAGRELRVIVNSTKVDDKQALILCRGIAKEIEKELNYPGEIKVSLIRETRVVEYAR